MRLFPFFFCLFSVNHAFEAVLLFFISPKTPETVRGEVDKLHSYFYTAFSSQNSGKSRSHIVNLLDIAEIWENPSATAIDFTYDTQLRTAILSIYPEALSLWRNQPCIGTARSTSQYADAFAGYLSALRFERVVGIADAQDSEQSSNGWLRSRTTPRLSSHIPSSGSS